VHRDAHELLRDGGEEAYDLDLAGLPHLVQRPGAVLAAAPGDQGLRTGIPLCAGTGPSRSLIPEQADHRFRRKPIADSGAPTEVRGRYSSPAAARSRSSVR
jgi:hypothetical protein